MSLVKTAFIASLAGISVLLVVAPAQAQRTGDHIVPSIETVCDGDPFNFGLCNAYCEALDCESPTPLGTPRACSNLLRNYMKKSGGALPPCACPCAFRVRSDFDILIEQADTVDGIADIDLDATYIQDCGDFGPDGEPAFLAEAFQVLPNPEDDPQGVRLFYWLTPADGEDPATCNEEGGGLDGALDPFFDWAYGPYIERTGIPLEEGEFEACQAALTFLCSEQAQQASFPNGKRK